MRSSAHLGVALAVTARRVSVRLALSALLTACIALASALAPSAAAFGEPSGGIDGRVSAHFGLPLDSFAHSSDGAASWTRTDSADDPDPSGDATGRADLTFTTTGADSGTMDARGNASASAGTVILREASGNTAAGTVFQVTQPMQFSATGSLSATSSSGQCCFNARAMLQSFDGVGGSFEVSVQQVGDSTRAVAASGILQPGRYQFSVEAHASAGFGANASLGDTGSAAFDVRFELRPGAPTPVIAGGPSGTTSARSATFVFGAVAPPPGRFECRLDGVGDAVFMSRVLRR